MVIVCGKHGLDESRYLRKADSNISSPAASTFDWKFGW
jgi:hypothetical protein